MEIRTSPLHSPVGSMASSPAPTQLTPRSKVRAMLKALDDDSGSDKENATIHKQGAGKADLKAASPLKLAPSHRTALDRMPFHDDTSEEEQDEMLAKSPRSNAVSFKERLNNTLAGAAGAVSDGSDIEGLGSNAYERVKRQMLKDSPAKHSQPTARRESKSVGMRSTRSPDLDERAIQRIRTISPPSIALSPTHSPTRQRQVSPGLFVSPTKPLESSRADGADDHVSSDSDSNKSMVEAQNRLHALVARKRAEREAKEREAHQISSDEDELDDSRPKPKSKKALQSKRGVALESEDDDEEAGTKFTQQARPTRKASKKAIQEMNRETQRMSRNMQLTHEARTKTKFTTADLFKKLNFRQSGAIESVAENRSKGASSSGAPSSDVEQTSNHQTPPSSPPSLGPSPPKAAEKAPMIDLTVINDQDDADSSSEDELPSLEQVMTQHRQDEEEQIRDDLAAAQAKSSDTAKDGKPSIRKFAKSAKKALRHDDSDEELEIVKPTKPSRIRALDQISGSKKSDSHSLHALKALAHLNEHRTTKGLSKESLTPGELRLKLQRRARDQAAIEKAEKIQALRDKGIIVQTEEEREGEQLQLENMLDRARAEADELAKKEKEARNREGNGEGALDGLPDSDDEDEDYQASDDAADIDGSGSENEVADRSGSDEDGDDEDEAEIEDEEEDEDPDLEREEVDGVSRGNAMIDDQADEDDEDEDVVAKPEAMEPVSEDDELAGTAEHDELTTPDVPRSKSRRKVVVESDDDDEPSTELTPKPALDEIIRTPKAALADAFGFAKQKSPGMGLSQVFGGTMAGTQTQADDDTPIQNGQDSLAFLRGLPPVDMATIGAEVYPETQVQDSQNAGSESGPQETTLTQPIFAMDTHSQRPYPETQSTDLLDATQDGGFQTAFSPARTLRTAETPGQETQSTVDTVMLPVYSPIVKRKGRLQRGRPSVLVEASQDDQEGAEEVQSDEGNSTQNAFLIMKDAAKKSSVPTDFDKKHSKAKNMFEEQAEESDDEYAGLGGASDDDSQGELDEETRRMINNAEDEKLNAGQVAARYHAQKLADDEKETSKLYKDITMGGLRRKRGAGVDLLDSDDEDEAIARRRAAKQREFAKMRKALLADEKIGKIAENPKRQAFLQAIADYAEDDEMNFLDQPGEDSQSQLNILESQETPLQQPLAPTTGNATKRKRDDSAEGQAEDSENRPAPHLRRANKLSTRPPPSDIRRTLSEMIGEPEGAEADAWPMQHETRRDTSPSGDEDDGDHIADKQDREDAENDLYRPPTPPRQQTSDATSSPTTSPHNPRRTAATSNRRQIIDRMALNRQSSSSLDKGGNRNNNTSSSRLAFAAPNPTNNNSSFRIPSLLRRATTNNASHASSMDGQSNSSVSMPISQQQQSGDGLGGMGKEGIPKRGGSAKSSVNYYVREGERRRKVEEGERERREGRERVGRLRRMGSGASGLGVLAGGTFG